MRRIKFIYIIYFMMLNFLTSCLATSSLKKADHRISHYNREFRVEDKNDSLVKGTCSGIEKIAGHDYYHLQFDSLLIGHKRLLDIYLPVEAYQYDPIIKESKTKIEKGQDVLACVSHYFSMDEQSFKYKLFYPTQEVANEPEKKLLQMLKKENQKDAPDPFIALELDLTNVFESKINANIWKKDTLGNWNGGRYYYYPRRPDHWFEPQVKWKKRSRIGSILIKPLYLVTVAIDIVSCPFQLLLLKGVVR
jgi:hypothetical protein